MTVKDLIENLSQIEDQDALVITRGYEGGYDDVLHNVMITDIALNVNTEWYYGVHERVEHVNKEELDKYKIVKAIII